MPRPGGGRHTSAGNLPVWDDFVNIKRAGIRLPASRSILPSGVRPVLPVSVRPVRVSPGPVPPVRTGLPLALPVAPQALRVPLSVQRAVQPPP
jgi:hypothetical protein